MRYALSKKFIHVASQAQDIDILLYSPPHSLQNSLSKYTRLASQ